MFSIEKANELEVIDKLPATITVPAFAEKRILWIKETKHPHIANNEISGKRYEYIKIGRTFGFETTRYVAYASGHLFYYDVVIFSFRVSPTKNTRDTVRSKMSMCSGWRLRPIATCFFSPMATKFVTFSSVMPSFGRNVEQQWGSILFSWTSGNSTKWLSR